MATENAKFAVQNLFNVDGWVCVVTGGGTGIGLMIAQAFANNGARVYITSRRQDVLEQATKRWGSSLIHPRGKIIPAVCDVTSKDSVRQLVDEIGKDESQVDLLVNNAGISKASSEVEKGEHSVEALAQELFNEEPRHWEDIYKTNVIGPFFVSAAFLPLLHAASKKSHHTGSIINISSISGITHTTQHHVDYNVSKAATIHLTTLLAQEFRRKAVRVRVNSIAPGIFPSEMTAGGSDEYNKSHLPHGEEFGKGKGIPANRPGQEEDVAQAALMLACNQYAYGQTLAIDGGYLLVHG
ncbi:hypothetical protein EDD16DRAFT_1689653 [Pisolithus croceorrhizus]|nr:hypothetical protein EDD16DRAFT_1689653 [Pisolithus croceorrhizus]KAI6135099.1 hypothetical protein EV401DRAFT_1845809 [Pisolithus croceorrhizus]KAI6163182.1 hypothetical protein EDD17DRAFT_1476926 [Pisolithus thermaeus]